VGSFREELSPHCSAATVWHAGLRLSVLRRFLVDLVDHAESRIRHRLTRSAGGQAQK
jgi:hypothetical protein